MIFKKKHQHWFDENSKDGEVDNVHKHYLLQWTNYSIGFGFLKSSNMPDEMQKELHEIFTKMTDKENKW